MISLDFATLYPLISHYFWPIVRLLALFMAAPLFTERQIAKRVKIGLALAIALLIAPGLPDPGILIFSLEGAWTCLQQMLIGIFIGLTCQFAFVTMRTAGEVIGLQMGLSFATFYDPSGGQNMPVVARILNLLVTLLFLVFNGHLWMISLLADSFVTLPPGQMFSSSNAFYSFVQTASVIFKSGLMLALPIVTLLLCLNLTLGLINRLTPQLSIFVIGFPLTLFVGMVALILLMSALSPFFQTLLAQLMDQLIQMLRMLA